MARARTNQWTPRLEETFLQALAMTCNVKLACAATGLSVTSAYVRRAKWPAFSRKWQAALETGYERLEDAMLNNAVNTLSGTPDLSPEAPLPPISINDALQLLWLHRYSVRGEHNPMRHRRRPKSPEEGRLGILRKLELVERAAARERRKAETTGS